VTDSCKEGWIEGADRGRKKEGKGALGLCTKIKRRPIKLWPK